MLVGDPRWGVFFFVGLGGVGQYGVWVFLLWISREFEMAWCGFGGCGTFWVCDTNQLVSLSGDSQERKKEERLRR